MPQPVLLCNLGLELDTATKENPGLKRFGFFRLRLGL